MGYKVTSPSRRVAMAALLTLAVAGGIIRYLAPNPSTLRDLGTVLLVLWLPAVGNLIAFFIAKVPRSVPPATDFPAGSSYAPQLQVLVQPMGVPADLLQAVDPTERRCTILVGRRGFTARLAQPLVQTFAPAGEQTLALELLHPGVALGRLGPGTELHLLVGSTAVAKGRVLDAQGTAAPLQAGS
jgi:hypothetical protein